MAEEHKPKWLLEHEQSDNSRFDAIEKHLESLPKKEDIEDILFLAIKRVLKGSYGGLLVVAGIVGALTVIFGGFKWLLALLGFNLLKQ